MTYVGIRDLKIHLSRYLRKVKAGESLAITDHGHPVAVLAPSPKGDREETLWRLVRKGIIRWNGEHPHFKNRKLIKIKGKPLSQTVIEMRREERY